MKQFSQSLTVISQHRFPYKMFFRKAKPALESSFSFAGISAGALVSSV